MYFRGTDVEGETQQGHCGWRRAFAVWTPVMAVDSAWVIYCVPVLKQLWTQRKVGGGGGVEACSGELTALGRLTQDKG